MKKEQVNKIIGREKEASLIETCLNMGKNILIEGPVGVGKTYLASVICEKLNRKIFRVDGDSRYTEQKLVGYFDPPLVLKKGYQKDVFVYGPLLEAMQEGAILFINELNRMPEGIQNILLPAIDEKLLYVPRLGMIKAKEGFSLIATMNPKEFVATSHISEAVLDRFECIFLDYQSEEEEKAILRYKIKSPVNEELLDWSIKAVQKTRESPNIKRGASIRAAISIYSLALDRGGDLKAFREACDIALMNRIELSIEAFEEGRESVLEEIMGATKKKVKNHSSLTKSNESEKLEGNLETNFIAPDAFSDIYSMSEGGTPDNGWNNAIVFHEIKKKIKNKETREKAKDIAVKAVLKRAERIVGSISRPYTYSVDPWKDYPSEELAIEESLEEDPFLQELSIERKKEIETEVILCLDTSLSMIGEKMALLAVSIAAISFELKSENFSIINFESNANLIKPLGSYSTTYKMVQDFLNSSAQGLTNMEDALKLAISEWDRGKTTRRHVILMSDGKYTAGNNPKHLAQYLPKLHIVQIGKSWAKNRFYQSLASAGGGEFLRVSNFESLPKKLYTLVYRMMR